MYAYLNKDHLKERWIKSFSGKLRERMLMIVFVYKSMWSGLKNEGLNIYDGISINRF